MSATEPSVLAISLSRLLSRLEPTLSDPQKLSSLNEVELSKAAANVDNARKLVIQLERSEGPGKPDKNAIGQQRQRVLQMHSLITRQQLERSNIPESEDEEDNTKESVITTTATTSNEPISVMRNRLFGDRQDTPVDQSTENVLSHHRMLQDDIAESMVGMARNLKDRSIAFGEALREDSKLVANASELLGKNAEKMTQTGGRLQAYTRTSRGMTWFILGSIVAVLFAWLVMYFLIRITYFVRL